MSASHLTEFHFTLYDYEIASSSDLIFIVLFLKNFLIVEIKTY